MFKKGSGKPPGSGRKAGTPNKKPAEFVQDMYETYGEVGGKAWLRRLAQKEPVEFLKAMLKTLPKDMTITAGDTNWTIVTGVPQGVDIAERMRKARERI